MVGHFVKYVAQSFNVQNLRYVLWYYSQGGFTVAPLKSVRIMLGSIISFSKTVRIVGKSSHATPGRALSRFHKPNSLALAGLGVGFLFLLFHTNLFN